MAIDVLEPRGPGDDSPREEAVIEETADFFAMTHLGEAGTDEDGNRIPAQQPGLLTNLGDGTDLNPLVGDFATVTIEDPVANAQIIHNAADPAVEEVDVWVDGELTLEQFGFREATGFVEIPAGDVEVALAPSGADLEDAVTFDLSPAEGANYTLIANGVVDPDQFADNPEEISIGLDVLVNAGSAEEAENDNEIEFFVVHGVTDAPAVDVINRDTGDPLVSDVSYGDISDNLSIPTSDYELDITAAGQNEPLFSFVFDFGDLGGNAAAVLASGFVDPEANQDGESFSLIAVLPDGTVVEGQDITSAGDELATETPHDFNLNQNYPNPFNPSTNISYELPEAADVRLTVFDVLGREVEVLVNEEQSAGSYEVTFDAADLSSGTYIYRIEAGEFNQTRQMMFVK